jgi:hypothetical protein
MTNEKDYNYKFGTLNRVGRDLDSFVDDDPSEVSRLERIRKLAERPKIGNRDDIREWTGVVLKVLDTHENQDYSHSQMGKITNPSGEPLRQCIVRIPELHAAIPEPTTTNPEDPDYDDVFIELHDVFTIKDLHVATPAVNDLVVCDYMNRYNMTDGVITSVPNKAGSYMGGLLLGEGLTPEQMADLFKGGAPLTLSPQSGIPAADDAWVWTQDKKIGSLHPELRGKVLTIMQVLRSQGFNPMLNYGWRSSKEQAMLVKRGWSKVSFSFHNATLNGKPAAVAADIVDASFIRHSKDRMLTGGSEVARKAFWSALGKAAKDQGLVWGGDWASFRDYPHVQLYPNNELARVRRESTSATV